MKTHIKSFDLDAIYDSIRKKYKQAAKNLDGLFAYPTGRAGLDGLNYDRNLTGRLPGEVAENFCGVGNPFTAVEIEPGAQVLDIGCGAGVDTILAAMMAGDNGKAVGIDLTGEMIEMAKKNKEAVGVDNVEFIQTAAEKLDFPEEHFDVIISNGVFNLIPDKRGVLKAAYRLLKPGGRMVIADQFARGEQVKDISERIKTWFQ
jgi:2-polyprenyl-3-methyl-5-hydroxy-6-metoxy-1,4-benzoquinol methylase